MIPSKAIRLNQSQIIFLYSYVSLGTTVPLTLLMASQLLSSDRMDGHNCPVRLAHTQRYPGRRKSKIVWTVRLDIIVRRVRTTRKIVHEVFTVRKVLKLKSLVRLARTETARIFIMKGIVRFVTQDGKCYWFSIFLNAMNLSQISLIKEHLEIVKRNASKSLQKRLFHEYCYSTRTQKLQYQK